MYRHILIATDGSELAQKAVEQGLELAKHLKAAVTAVTVTEAWPVAVADGVIVSNPIDGYEKAARRSAPNRPVRHASFRDGSTVPAMLTSGTRVI